MNEETESLLSRGVAGLVWAETRLFEVERSEGSSPDLLRMQRDCASLLGRLGEELRGADDPEFSWHSMLPVLLSGQDLTFLETLRDYLARDAKGGGGHLQAILRLERFLSRLMGV